MLKPDRCHRHQHLMALEICDGISAKKIDGSSHGLREFTCCLKEDVEDDSGASSLDTTDSHSDHSRSENANATIEATSHLALRNPIENLTLHSNSMFFDRRLSQPTLLNDRQRSVKMRIKRYGWEARRLTLHRTEALSSHLTILCSFLSIMFSCVN